MAHKTPHETLRAESRAEQVRMAHKTPTEALRAVSRAEQARMAHKPPTEALRAVSLAEQARMAHKIVSPVTRALAEAQAIAEAQALATAQALAKAQRTRHAPLVQGAVPASTVAPRGLRRRGASGNHQRHAAPNGTKAVRTTAEMPRGGCASRARQKGCQKPQERGRATNGALGPRSRRAVHWRALIGSRRPQEPTVAQLFPPLPLARLQKEPAK